MCIRDRYQSVVFAVENDVPLLKILTDNKNCHFSSCGGIETTSVLSTRLPIDVNHHLEVLLALRNRINSSLKVQNILVVFMQQLLQLANQYWLNARVDITTDVPLIVIVTNKVYLEK